MGSINMNKTKIAVMLGALSSFGAQASLIIDGDAQSNGGKVTATVGVVESVKPEAVKPAPQVKEVVKEAVKQEVKEFKGVPETKMGKHFSMSSMENSGVAPKPVVKKEEVKNITLDWIKNGKIPDNGQEKNYIENILMASMRLRGVE